MNVVVLLYCSFLTLGSEPEGMTKGGPLKLGSLLEGFNKLKPRNDKGTISNYSDREQCNGTAMY